jgi:hypothetical protein
MSYCPDLKIFKIIIILLYFIHLCSHSLSLSLTCVHSHTQIIEFCISGTVTAFDIYYSMLQMHIFITTHLKKIMTENENTLILIVYEHEHFKPPHVSDAGKY